MKDESNVQRGFVMDIGGIELVVCSSVHTFKNNGNPYINLFLRFTNVLVIKLFATPKHWVILNC